MDYHSESSCADFDSLLEHPVVRADAATYSQVSEYRTRACEERDHPAKNVQLDPETRRRRIAELQSSVAACESTDTPDLSCPSLFEDMQEMASLTMPGPGVYSVLHFLHSKMALNVRLYFEIGVATGQSLRCSQAARVIGLDPQPDGKLPP